MPRLLTFNCHEAWVHQLTVLDTEVDVVDGLPGRYTKKWDIRMRPVPPGFRLISLEEALGAPEPYDCIIAHNLADLLCVKHLEAPRLLILHVSLAHRLVQAGLTDAPGNLRATIKEYLAFVGGRVVAVTEAKRDDWELGGDVIESCADTTSYLPATHEEPAGLRISNQISTRKRYLLWDFHEAAFADIPVRIVGHNPDLPGVQAADSWAELKRMLSRHRFFIHTADPQLEDGFNMALMEAAAAGLPILGNRHPTSPVEHGTSGFLSDDPIELGGFARRLLNDVELAAKMGKAAQELARRRFAPLRFARQLRSAISKARTAWVARICLSTAPTE